MDFKNEVAFLEQDDQYKMVWSNSAIYPGLTEDDKVRVSVIQAQRGQILDRNGRMLQERVLLHLLELYLES